MTAEYKPLWLDATTGDTAVRPVASFAEYVVMLTGAQTVAGEKTFSNDARFNGRVGVGAAPFSTANVTVSGTTSGVDYHGYINTATLGSTTTNRYEGFRTFLGTEAASFTNTHLRHFIATQGTIGAGSTVTNQYGFEVQSSLVGATNNYGFYGNIPAGSGRWNLWMVGTAANHLAGSLGIGTTGSLTFTRLNIGGTLPSDFGLSRGMTIIGTVPSSATTQAQAFRTHLSVQNAAFTLPSLQHFAASQDTIGGSATVTEQVGFLASSDMTGAGTNYGFRGDLSAGTGRWNSYMQGTAFNYMNGNLGLGTASSAIIAANKVTVGATLPSSGSVSRGFFVDATVPSSTTVLAESFRSHIQTQAASFTLSQFNHFSATQSTIGAGSAITTQIGFIANSNLVGAINNYGFFGDLPVGTGLWNLYMSSTAWNYIGGPLLAGQTTSTGPGGGNTIVGACLHPAGTLNLSAASSSALRANRNSDGILQVFHRSGVTVGYVDVTDSTSAYHVRNEDTALFSPAASTISLRAGGNEHLRVTSTAAQVSDGDAWRNIIGIPGAGLPPFRRSGVWLRTAKGPNVTVRHIGDNRIELSPFWCSEELVIDRLWFEVTNAAASSNAKIVVYSANADGTPNALLHESGNISTATTGGKEHTVSLTFRAGRMYWIGIRCSHVVQLRAASYESSTIFAADVNSPGTAGLGAAILRRDPATFVTAAPSTWTWDASEISAGTSNTAVNFLLRIA